MNRYDLARVERLQSRRLFSATAVVQDGQLIVTGTTAADDITVSESSGNLIVTDGGSQLFSQAASSVSADRIYITGGGGADSITIDSSVPFAFAASISDSGKSDQTIDEAASLNACDSQPSYSGHRRCKW